MKKTIITLAILAVVVGGALFFLLRDNKKLQVVTEKPVERTLQITVTSSGNIQPVDQILVGTQVSGTIERIYVDFNDHVKAGQLLAELDKSVLQERVSQSQASLASARSDLQLAQSNYNRTRQLYDQQAETQTNLETATNRLDVAKVALSNAQSNLKQAQTNLSYAEIRSPISGVVQNRAVDEGQTVAASFNTPTLFTIANNLKNMQVQTNVDEADIGKVRLGQKVFFTVDSYPNDTFPGEVNQIRLQPVTTSNVVTYTVIIDAPNPDEKLLPGMTAYSNIVTQEQRGITVPNEAFNLYPAEEVSKFLTLVPLEPRESKSGDRKKGDRKPDAQRSRSTGDRQRPQTLWVKTGENTYTQKLVKTGLTDGIYTIVEHGIAAEDEILLSVAFEKETKKQAAANPLMPQQRPGGSRNTPGGMNTGGGRAR